jgi:hypothetical protein
VQAGGAHRPAGVAGQKGTSMRTSVKRSLLGLAAAAFSAASLATAVPASAAPGDTGTLTLYADAYFRTPVAGYDAATLGTQCHQLPSTAHAELNLTAKTLQIYATPDCGGAALTFPANDIHSFISFDALSFRAG